jgi:hypothetical protein
MRTIVCLLMLVGVCLPVSAQAQTQQPLQSGSSGVGLACFSPQRAFAESADGKAGIARLSAL